MGNASEIRLPLAPGPAAHAAPEKLAAAAYRVMGLSEIGGMVVAGDTAQEVVRPYRALGIQLTLPNVAPAEAGAQV
jgi:hypothetical protein